MRARDAIITVLDFETTGVVRGWPDEPWQIGLVAVRGAEVDAATGWTSFLRVGDRPFSPSAPGAHARHRAALAAAPGLPALWPALRGRLASGPLAAHHAAVERRVLRRALPLHRLGPWIDTLKLARLAYPELPSHTLEDLAEGLGLADDARTLCPGRGPHDALYDAFACALLLAHLLRRPGWDRASVDALARAAPAPPPA
jgi:DNA polymerase-3 subunit epsilon